MRAMEFTTFFTCRVSMHGRCQGLLWLSEFSDVVLSCFTLSHYTIFTEISPLQPEESLIPLFKAIVYSRSWIRKLVDRLLISFLFQPGDRSAQQLSVRKDFLDQIWEEV